MNYYDHKKNSFTFLFLHKNTLFFVIEKHLT